jgi:hypothetical protein
MNKPLQLIIYLNRSDCGNVVFRNGEQHCKIANLRGILPFAGGMEQLCRAIASGADQLCEFVLQDSHGKQWVLECQYADRMVTLNLRLKGMLMFSWQGSGAGFRAGIQIV